MTMAERNLTFEQREKTLELFLEDLQGYKKKNRKFNETSGMQSPMWYVFGVPPYAKKMTMYGSHPRLESRLILFSDYLLFLTEWDPEKATKTKRMTAGSFLKEFASEGISELTWGVSDILGTVVNAVVPSESMSLLGKKPEEMLSNPWSLIIPLDDIVKCELLKVSFTTHYLYLHAKHRFEGDLDIGITYHSGGIHSRADGLYKKMQKQLKERSQRQKYKPAAVLLEKNQKQESIEEQSKTQPRKSLPKPSVNMDTAQALTSAKNLPTQFSTDYQNLGITQNGKESTRSKPSQPLVKEEVKHRSDSHFTPKFQSSEDLQKPRKNILSWVIVSVLSIISVILLFSLVQAQDSLYSTRRRLDRALDTIDAQNDEINSLIETQDNLDSTRERLDRALDTIDAQNDEIDSLNSKISSMSSVKITRVDVKNEGSNNQYLFLDNRLVAGTRGGGETYFYIPPGTYDFQSCGDPYRSSCGSKKEFTVSSSTTTWTVR